MSMQCPNGCASPMEPRREEKIVYRYRDPVVISNLLMYVCPTCGQETMPLASARLVEEILNGKRKPTGTFTAELYEIEAG